MSPSRAIEVFEAVFARRHAQGLDDVLAAEVILKPPTYWKVWRGRPRVARLLQHAAASIDHLQYVRRYADGRHAALQFEARIGRYDFSGVDALTIGDDGLIAEIEIFARPPKAVALLSERMGAALAADPLFAALG